MSKEITIKFCCKKSDGWIEKFTEKDKINPIKRAKFVLSWNDGEGLEPSIIKKCELLDNGIVDDGEVVFEDHYAIARFYPIVRFHLKEEVDAEAFRKSVWESYVKIDFEEDFILWEDNQGYTEIIEEYELDELDKGKFYTVKQMEKGILLK